MIFTKRVVKDIFFVLIAIILFSSNNVYAYTCEYGSESSKGCGKFTIEVKKGKETTKNDIKFSISGMELNEFTLTDGWKYFVTGDDLNGECPEVYYKKEDQPGYENYCDINLGFGDWDYSKYTDYISDYGTNLSDPNEPEPVVPEENKDEIYYTRGVDGHIYTDAGGCIYGEPRNVYVEAAKKTIIACVASKAGNEYALPMISTDDPDISCGYSQYHDTFKATMENGEITYVDKDGDHFYSGVCYGVSLDPNYDGTGNIESPDLDTDIPEINTCNMLLGYPSQEGSPAYYLVRVFNVIKYVAIILLIVLSLMDLFSAIASQDKDVLKKTANKILKRFILCIVIFLLPYLVGMLLKYIANRQADICGIK